MSKKNLIFAMSLIITLFSLVSLNTIYGEEENINCEIVEEMFSKQQIEENVYEERNFGQIGKLEENNTEGVKTIKNLEESTANDTEQVVYPYIGSIKNEFIGLDFDYYEVAFVKDGDNGYAFLNADRDYGAFVTYKCLYNYEGFDIVILDVDINGEKTPIPLNIDIDEYGNEAIINDDIGIYLAKSNSTYNYRNGLFYKNDTLYAASLDLDEVEIPNNIKNIAVYAFTNHKFLKEITFSESLSTIDYEAFSGCNLLRKVVFSGDYPNIERTAFLGDAFFAYYPENKKNWNEGIYTYLDGNIRWISIDEDISNEKICGINLKWEYNDLNATLSIIGHGDMFDYENENVPWNEYKNKIETVMLSEGVSSIGTHSFDGCTNLTNIYIPRTIKSIKNYALSDCTNLKSINFLAGAITISDNAFLNDSFTIYYSPYYYSWTYNLLSNYGGTDIVWMLNGYNYDQKCGNNIFWSFNEESKILTISGSGTMFDYSDKNEPGWKDHAYEIELIEFNGEISHIGAYSFFGLNKLSTIVLPETIKSIGSNAFGSCEKLNNIIFLGDMPNEISLDAFYGDNIVVHFKADKNSWNSFDASIFGENVHNAYATKEDSTYCGDNLQWTFNSETKTLAISGSGNMYDFGNGSGNGSNPPWFSIKYDIENVELPSGITTIGNYAFWGCEKLHEINFPDTLEYIGDYSFTKCFTDDDYFLQNSNVQLSASEKLAYFGDYVFDIESAYGTKVYIDGNLFFSKNLQYLGEGALKNTNIESVEFDRNSIIKEIKNNTFDSSRLQCISLPNNLIRIGNASFDSCPIDTIEMPKSLQILEDMAFRNTNIESVILWQELHEFGGDVFSSPVTESIVFKGNYPNETFNESIFLNESKFKVYYPSNNYTWTKDKLESYSGQVTYIEEGKFDDKCGDNLTWNYNKDSKILTINGTGDMYNYDKGSPHQLPWIEYRDDIETVVLSDEITHIGNYAFANYENIKSINFPTSLVSIGSHAFSGSLLYPNEFEIVLPQTLNYIGPYAFNCSTGIHKVQILGNIDTIYENTFYFCFDLETVILPDSIKNIDNFAFNSCKIKDFSVPNGLEKLGAYSLGGLECMSLHMPNTIKEIGESSIGNDVHNLYFEGNMPEISVFAFEHNILTLHYPKDNDTWKNFDRFDSKDRYIDYLENIILWDNGENSSNKCGENLSWDYDSNTKTITISGSGEMYQFNKVDNHMPWINSIYEVENLIIEEGVTSIGSYAFCGAVNLKEISIPSSVNKIGDYAFYRCDELKYDIGVISTNLTSIGVNAFGYCQKIEGDLVISSNCSYVGDYAFKYNGITSIKIENGLSCINPGVFSECTKVSSIILADSIKTIKNDSFSDTKMDFIVLPKYIEDIELNSFNGCSNLAQITIPSTLNHLGNNVFSDCTNLKIIDFLGDLPEITKDNYMEWGLFSRDVLTVTYPSNNDTWTKDKFQDYGGSIMWVAKKDLSNDTIGKFVVYANKNGNQIYAAVKDKSNYVIIDENGDTLEYVIDGETQIIPYIGDIEMADMDEVKKGLYDGVLGKYHKSGYKLVDINYHVSKNNKEENTQNNAPARLMAAPLLAEPVEDNNDLAIISALPDDSEGATYTIEVNNKDFIGSDPGIIGIGYDNEEFAVSDVKYNDETGEITFKTNKFGTFIVVKDIKESKCSLKSSTLTLEDDIKVNLLFEMDDDVKTDETAYMLLRNTATNETKKIFVKDMPIKNDKSVASMSVVSKRIGDVIEAQLFVDDKPASEVFKYSGKQYIKTVLNPEYANASWNSEKLINVCKALANYSSYSQIELSYNTESLTNNDVYMEDTDKDVSDVDANTLSKYQATANGSVEGIAVSTAKLDLAAQTKCTLSFTLSGGHTKDEYTFTVNGEEVEPSESNGKLIIEFSSVAKKLGELVPITVTDNSHNTYTVNYCPLSYAYQVVKSQTSDLYTESLKDVCRALYKYYVAADYYFTVSEQ